MGDGELGGFSRRKEWVSALGQGAAEGGRKAGLGCLEFKPAESSVPFSLQLLPAARAGEHLQ